MAMNDLVTRAHFSEPLERRDAFLEVRADEPSMRMASVCWSTGAKRRLFDPLQGRHYWERLIVSPEAVDIRGLQNGPLINGHRQDGIHNLFGTVENVRIEDGKGYCDLRFSARADVEPYYQDVKEGIIRAVSVGYRIDDYRDDYENGELVRTVTKWTPKEISLVPVGADPGAVVLETRADPPAFAADCPPLPHQAERNMHIRSIARLSGLDQAWVDAQIDGAAPLDQVRAAAFEAMQARAQTPVQTTQHPRLSVGIDHEDPALRGAYMGEALWCRMHPTHQPSAPAREYIGFTFADFARDMLHRRGISPRGFYPEQLITRALQTTSDFAYLFSDTVTRTLRQEYEAASSPLRRLGRQTTARDYRSKTSVVLSGMEELARVTQHGEFQYSSLSDSGENYAVIRFGRIIGVTKEMLVNDDLGALNNMTRFASRAARRTENNFLVSLLTANSGLGPTMSDGLTLFHATHGNLVATGAGAIPSENSLNDARVAMRRQTNHAGEVLGITPRTLLVPPELETTGQKLLTSIDPNSSEAVNPFSTMALDVESLLAEVAPWYVIADVNLYDGLEYAYLEGQTGPQVDSRINFNTKGVEVSIELNFGAGFVDYRGWYLNQGA